MTTIDSIKIEVAQKVDEFSEICIVDAIRNRGVFCPFCNYPQNATDYDYLLWHYAHMKQRLHRMKKIPKYRQEDINYLHIMIAKTKLQMMSIKPCKVCIKLYNPHNSKKFGSVIVPIHKEFFDE